MAKTFYTDLDLNRNKLLNGVIHPSATPPENPVAGQIYFDTDAKKLKYFDGNAWTESGGGGSAGVSSLGGATGAITLGGGLAMSNNVLALSGITRFYYFKKLVNDGETSLKVEFENSDGSPTMTRDKVSLFFRNEDGEELECVKKYGEGFVTLYFDSGLPGGVYYGVAFTEIDVRIVQ